MRGARQLRVKRVRQAAGKQGVEGAHVEEEMEGRGQRSYKDSSAKGWQRQAGCGQPENDQQGGQVDREAREAILPSLWALVRQG